MGERGMTGPLGTAFVSTALLCGALAMGLPAASAAAAIADQPVEAAAAGAADDGSATLRDAIQLMARHFGFTVIGANRLGTDAPSWPVEDLGPEATLGTLLKDYGYIVMLKPEASPGAAREPATVMIVGLNHAPPPEPVAKPVSASPILASAVPRRRPQSVPVSASAVLGAAALDRGARPDQARDHEWCPARQ